LCHARFPPPCLVDSVSFSRQIRGQSEFLWCWSLPVEPGMCMIGSRPLRRSLNDGTVASSRQNGIVDRVHQE
jgi:hypothetical protein